MHRPRLNRNLLVLVSAVALLFMVAGAGLGLWSAREMREVVADQFNQQQLVIARHVSALLERQFAFLKKELLLLKKQNVPGHMGAEAYHGVIQDAFPRVLESGVWRIEILEPDTSMDYVFTPFRQWSAKEMDGARLRGLPVPESLGEQDVWVSETDIKPYGIGLSLVTSLPGDTPRLLVFNLNISWFLSPFVRDIRSGRTGYVWLIDEKGNFLYHPNTEFIGKSAFQIREEKYPGVSFGIIRFIQQERMLQGETGTGSYSSGWHRGITGNIKKLIAYCPLMVSEHPLRKWSTAVVAPTSEIEDTVHRGYLRLFFLQGLVIMVILAGAAAVLFFEMRWARVLEERVEERTEDLKKSEEKHRSLVESAEDFIFTVDSEGVFQSMNTFTATFFGGRSEEFIGKNLAAVFPGEVAEKQLHLIKQVYRVGKSTRDEFEVEMGDQRIWLSANFMPLKDERGAVNAILCIARDITENKNLERQLINTEKLASMGTLAAGVAHEVNNPLGVILGFCDLLLRKAKANSQEFEDLKTIERQGLHCKQVVENLLSFARLGEGDVETAELNECVQDIIKVVKHTLDMHDIDLSLSLYEDPLPVKGDPRQLQQVFLNLINNAVSAMPTGGTLKIRTSQERPTRRAVIQFQDDGIGIREEHMDRIFEPFFTTKPEGEGTGLGLFVSYGIITKYGGTIDCASHHASSSRPSGTTFTVKLPARP
ncbi:MAG: PAS domain S-box protein [Deltaproteobacteria bacterium]|nr:PAS domain S-box protein [Deltaproteobacteria bacterium]